MADARGTASWYSVEACKVNPDPVCPTASGKSLYELETFGVQYAAMWNVPFGTRFKVTNLANKKTVLVEIWDRGPNKRLGRLIDLSKLAFSQIADVKQGIINVKIERVI